MLGVIMLDTLFPRFPGDIGNPQTFDFPVKYLVVRDAFPVRVVCDADPELLRPFIRAAKQLENEGARLICTSCGFLSIFQRQIAGELKVPFISSSLLQVPMVHSMLGKDKKVGILTAHAGHLTSEHFAQAGAENIPLVIQGMEGEYEFSKVFIGNSPEADFNRLEQEVGRMSATFAGRSDIGAIVLECTNLPPFESRIRKVTGLPVFHLNSLINMVYRML